MVTAFSTGRVTPIMHPCMGEMVFFGRFTPITRMDSLLGFGAFQALESALEVFFSAICEIVDGF